MQVDGEAADGAEPQPVPVGCGVPRRGGPRHHRVDGQARDAQRVEVAGEIQQQPAGLFQLIPQ